jgi:hypothetical protein
MNMNERLTDEEIDAIQEHAYRALRASGYNGGMGGETWDRASARAIESAVLARAAVPAPTADVDAWARARWPGHQLHDNGKDTPLMVLIRDVWRAARAAVSAVQPQEPVAKVRITRNQDLYGPAAGVEWVWYDLSKADALPAGDYSLYLAAPQAEARQEQPKQPDSVYSAQPKGEAATERDAAQSALARFKDREADTPELAAETPLERLRYFLSLALTGQDWLDVEPFLDALGVKTVDGGQHG